MDIEPFAGWRTGGQVKILTLGQDNHVRTGTVAPVATEREQVSLSP